MARSRHTLSSSTRAFDASEHAPLANEDAVILGSNVERLRVAAGFNVSNFAARANVSRPFLYKVERGESNPRLSDIQKLAQALGVQVVDLFTPSGQRTEDR